MKVIVIRTFSELNKWLEDNKKKTITFITEGSSNWTIFYK